MCSHLDWLNTAVGTQKCTTWALLKYIDEDLSSTLLMQSQLSPPLTPCQAINNFYSRDATSSNA